MKSSLTLKEHLGVKSFSTKTIFRIKTGYLQVIKLTCILTWRLRTTWDPVPGLPIQILLSFIALIWHGTRIALFWAELPTQWLIFSRTLEVLAHFCFSPSISSFLSLAMPRSLVCYWLLPTFNVRTIKMTEWKQLTNLTLPFMVNQNGSWGTYVVFAVH
jgi:hypothetical protein